MIFDSATPCTFWVIGRGGTKNHAVKKGVLEHLFLALTLGSSIGFASLGKAHGLRYSESFHYLSGSYSARNQRGDSNPERRSTCGMVRQQRARR